VSQFHAPAALPPGKDPRLPLERRLGGPQSRSGRREEKIMTIPGLKLRPFYRPARSQSLYRLRYLGSLKKKLNEELIPYFPLIMSGNGQKRCVQQFFHCSLCIRCRLTFLPSYCIATIRDTHRDTQTDGRDL
jgi:hypothetical protein